MSEAPHHGLLKTGSACHSLFLKCLPRSKLSTISVRTNHDQASGTPEGLATASAAASDWTGGKWRRRNTDEEPGSTGRPQLTCRSVQGQHQPRLLWYEFTSMTLENWTLPSFADTPPCCDFSRNKPKWSIFLFQIASDSCHCSHLQTKNALNTQGHQAGVYFHFTLKGSRESISVADNTPSPSLLMTEP